MGKKGKRIKELEAEVEELRAVVEYLSARLSRHYSERMARLRADLAVDAVSRACLDLCKEERPPTIKTCLQAGKDDLNWYLDRLRERSMNREGGRDAD